MIYFLEAEKFLDKWDIYLHFSVEIMHVHTGTIQNKVY